MNEQKVPSVGEWMVVLLILSIPLVNFIVLIYWAVSSSTNVIKSNFAKAALAWLVVIIFLYLMLFAAFFGAFLGNR